MEKIQKGVLGVTGEYYVAAELGKRNVYAQLTLGNQKRTDLLVFSESKNLILSIEVKCKQSTKWPACKGINDLNSFIVFVDFLNLAPLARPIFYILNYNDWSQVVNKKRFQRMQKYPNKTVEIRNNVMILPDELKKNGKPYEGCSISIEDIEGFRESWSKIIDKLNNGQ